MAQHGLAGAEAVVDFYCVIPDLIRNLHGSEVLKRMQDGTPFPLHMTIPPFSIPAVLSGVPDAELEFDIETVPPAPATHDLPLVSSLRFHVRFERQGQELQVELTGLSTAVGAECSRCGRAYDQPISLSRVTAYVPLDGFDEDYPVRIDKKKGEVDLSEWLRVEILSATDPLGPCHEDCRGRCPSCGRDLNAGPCDCVPEGTSNPFKELEKYFQK